MSERARLLEELRSAASQGTAAPIAAALEGLLAWLASPANDTDENCKAVDRFVVLEVLVALKSGTPEDLRKILEDMGTQLHDAHTSPELTQVFEATPPQLLARAREIRAGLTV